MGSLKMGQRDGFSEMDVEKLNQMYDCGYSSSPASAPSPPPVPAPTPTVGAGSAGNTGAVDNALINSFVSGIMTGLGFGDDATA